MFELVGGAIADDGVPAVEVKVGVEVMSDFEPGLFEGGKRGARGLQPGFERAPTGFGLGVVVGDAAAAWRCQRWVLGS